MIRSLTPPLAEYAKDKPAFGSDRLIGFEFTPVSDEPSEPNVSNREDR
jgi:hypothetical protein